MLLQLLFLFPLLTLHGTKTETLAKLFQNYTVPKQGKLDTQETNYRKKESRLTI